MFSICMRRRFLTSSFISVALLCSVFSWFLNSVEISGPGVGVAEDRSDKPGKATQRRVLFCAHSVFKVSDTGTECTCMDPKRKKIESSSICVQIRLPFFSLRKKDRCCAFHDLLFIQNTLLLLWPFQCKCSTRVQHVCKCYAQMQLAEQTGRLNYALGGCSIPFTRVAPDSHSKVSAQVPCWNLRASRSRTDVLLIVGCHRGFLYSPPPPLSAMPPICSKETERAVYSADMYCMPPIPKHNTQCAKHRAAKSTVQSENPHWSVVAHSVPFRHRSA